MKIAYLFSPCICAGDEKKWGWGEKLENFKINLFLLKSEKIK
jgi:hypothetical protein